MPRPTSTIVIALGGNAIARHGDDGTVAAQYRRVTQAMEGIVELALSGARIALTHGNGPVVGDIVLRGELAASSVTPTPLFIADADSQGGIGLMLQQVLGNMLRRAGSSLLPATIVTQVVVDQEDPALARPTKPIGPYYSADAVVDLETQRGWTLAEEPGRGWRRVVASPRPLRIVETPAVMALLDAGVIAIAAGGGGVPVAESTDGTLTGVDAVVDKDWSGALLARAVGAERFVVLMEADALYEHFGTPNERRIPLLDSQAAAALAPTLPGGGIGPKLAACAWFAAHGGEALICNTEQLASALAGDAGTRITP